MFLLLLWRGQFSEVLTPSFWKLLILLLTLGREVSRDALVDGVSVEYMPSCPHCVTITLLPPHDHIHLSPPRMGTPPCLLVSKHKEPDVTGKPQ